MPRSPLIDVHDVSPLPVVVLSIIHTLKATTDCLGDIGPVRTCHASWIKSSTSNRTPPRGGVHLPGYTLTRDFCKLCRTFIPVPGTSVSYVRPCHNTRNFWKFCNAFIPVPETSGSSVRLQHPYPESTNPTENNLAN